MTRQQNRDKYPFHRETPSDDAQRAALEKYYANKKRAIRNEKISAFVGIITGVIALVMFLFSIFHR